MSELRTPEVEDLLTVFSKIQDKDDIFLLLEDLFTIREVQDLSSRMEIAVMLSEKVTYGEIVEKTGASTATIGRVNRALNYGAGGYERVLERLKKAE